MVKNSKAVTIVRLCLYLRSGVEVEVEVKGWDGDNESILFIVPNSDSDFDLLKKG